MARGGRQPARSRPARGTLIVSNGAASAVRRGHPWIYRTQIRAGLESFVAGEVARVHDEDGAFVARAIVDPASPIAARAWSSDPHVTVDDALLRDRIAAAVSRRRAFLDHDATTAMRWVHGEGDRAPGVVIDRYGDVAVLRLDGDGIAAWAERIADVAFEIARAEGVRSLGLRSTRRGDETKLRPLRGDPLPDEIVVKEHGVPFVVDLAHGQKTGAFLDQRDNRRRVGALARGKRVLNLFSYAGGFSLHAALGGARSVTSVDVAAGAHATAQRSFRAAGVSLEGHDFVTADVWQFLDRAKERGERWDVIVSDPPNMAPSEATRARAITQYKNLHGKCAAVLAEGGVFCAASCSSHVSLDDFLGTLDDATLGRSDLRVLEIAGAGRDHPVLPAFPEGRYLEFCILA